MEADARIPFDDESGWVRLKARPDLQQWELTPYDARGVKVCQPIYAPPQAFQRAADETITIPGGDHWIALEAHGDHMRLRVYLNDSPHLPTARLDKTLATECFRQGCEQLAAYRRSAANPDA